MKKTLYIIVLSLFYILLSYSTFLIFNKDTLKFLLIEDGPIENIGALAWLIASIIFIYLYFKFKIGSKLFGFETRRNIFFLLLGILFFIAFGEEISWGQRIFDIQTPGYIQKLNVQHELNFHNLDFLYKDYESNKGANIISKLFLLFWVIYCLIIPILNKYNINISKYFNEMKLPIPPIWIGLLILFNYSLERIYTDLNLFNINFYSGEFKETNFALLFLILAIYFLRENTDKVNLLNK